MFSFSLLLSFSKTRDIEPGWYVSEILVWVWILFPAYKYEQ